MRRKILLGLLTLLFSSLIGKAQDSAEKAIRAVMRQQELAWNKGDIPTFMETYWKSDSLLFVGHDGPIYGWREALDRYRKTYPDQASMGKLTFQLLQLTPLSNMYYFVLGKWNLVRSNGNIGGTFTLLFKQIAGKWIIVADHTS